MALRGDFRAQPLNSGNMEFWLLKIQPFSKSCLRNEGIVPLKFKSMNSMPVIDEKPIKVMATLNAKKSFPCIPPTKSTYCNLKDRSTYSPLVGCKLSPLKISAKSRY